MRQVVPEKLGQGRIHDGEYASTADYGLTGAFQLIGPNGIDLRILSSGSDDGTGWEHVSVSCQHRTPNWQEMCFVKDLFWRESECVVQFHPPRSEYVNHHSYCLHLWKRVGAEIATPPSILVGPKEDNC